MKTKEYLILLGKNARKRHHHTTESGKVVGFVVQLEIYIKANGERSYAMIHRMDLHMLIDIISKVSRQKALCR
ncbi:hypothetical protein GWO43_30870 [candidate division KSB1 bacterium]|nr:hypothetical protein [candidate division KSB1 bacterium]NIR73075.1 hypothetical protein [candidate division KSB1 bacterium]NIS28316.1 hypothetical protein [candidate division KSB1 bacterium]NIT75185.1 hypothetical protein [candidate division KSB1 bacterium]NIU29022.1 hypothetical protein [candidate division KSB1 bacterium]